MSQVLNMIRMLTRQYFLEVMFKNWVEQKARLNSQNKSREYLCIKHSKTYFNDNNLYLKEKLGSKVGILPPCWTRDLGPHVNWP